ncbi:N-acetyltransferase [Neobacillus notoginsengisoli]|uniref:N-acetyltransferase n=1 Tax=Neobacillus notoginsengisoli TaxID=1578198 RepID=A0A417YKZ4_9BACI|nr:GNAT family protein [Neobacillus notoginsengisoli]RHW34166.1 N-acetyltransferase [Neobacillus notoginsengisoli]
MFTFKVDAEIELQLFQLQDCKRLYHLVNTNRNHLRDWLPWVDDMSSHYQYETIIPMWLKQFADNNGFNTGILYHRELVGAIGFHYIDWRNKHTSIGYYLAKNAEGNGIMTRSVQALLNYAFIDLGLNRVEIRCGEGNSKSRAIPERLGFTIEGRIRDGEFLYNKPHDLIVYGMLARDWNRKL